MDGESERCADSLVSRDLQEAVRVSELDEIKRLDDLGNALFQVCAAVSAAAVGLALAADQVAVRAVSGVIAAVLGMLAMIVVPDVVLGSGRSDLQSYVRKRQRAAARAIAGLFFTVYGGLAAAAILLIVDVDNPVLAIAATAAGVLGISCFAWFNWKDLWPPEIRGRERVVR
jgi:hypothetical protein